jgi:hypothetical protein
MTRLEKCLLAEKLGFTYDFTNGYVFTPSGKVLSKKTKNGYLMLTLRNKERNVYYLYAHQFAWFVKYIQIVDFIDHIDRDKTNNKIKNLRSVTKSQNAMNLSNIKGYSFCKRSKKFIAYIMVNYKKKHLGIFETEIEAEKCYLKNKEKYHIIN